MRNPHTALGVQMRLPTRSALCNAACLLCAALVVCVVFASRGTAQNTVDNEVPLYERNPFDRITLDQENDSARVDVYPIDGVDRSQAVRELPRTLTIRRLEDPADQLYTVSATHIVKLELFNYLLLDEAKRLITQGQVDEAFPYLSRLKEDFPTTAGLDSAVEEFFFADARNLFQSRRYDEALQALDEVQKINPNRSGLSRVMNRILNEIMRTEYSAENYSSARKKLEYARRRYGDMTSASAGEWERKLKEDAARELTAARESFSSGDATSALVAIRRAKEIWPDLPGVSELNGTILRKYPRVRVAVSQPFHPASMFDSRSLSLDWAARRASVLVTQRIVNLRDFTADGGQYESRVGSLKVAQNQRQLTLELQSNYANEVHQLSRAMLRAANPGSQSYSSRFAEYLESVYVPAAGKLEINLTRPALRPEGLLPQIVRRPTADVALFSSDFKLLLGEPGYHTFQATNASRNTARGVREILEQHFADPSEAADALLAGEVDVVDRVYPPDIPKLKSTASLRVVPYRLPTIHGLVFNDREVLLRSSTFRRGLLYGINRAEFVENEIVAGGQASTGKVLSGFAPIGLSQNDPLSYAYDQQIQPRAYDPSLGLVLLRLAIAEREQLTLTTASESTHAVAEADLTAEADVQPEVGDDDKRADEKPAFELPPLVIAYPNSPIAFAACSSIASDLRRLGIPAAVRPLASGTVWPADDDWDLLYIETTIEDPLVSLPELILGQSILGRHGGLVWQATRALQEASNLEEVRGQFRKIHKLTFDHTPMIPLWQIIEHKAVSTNLSGDSESPISLYQDVSNWRLGQ